MSAEDLRTQEHLEQLMALEQEYSARKTLLSETLETLQSPKNKDKGITCHRVMYTYTHTHEGHFVLSGTTTFFKLSTETVTERLQRDAATLSAELSRIQREISSLSP
jgi:hypothetical protein